MQANSKQPETKQKHKHTIIWIIAMVTIAMALILVFASKERRTGVELQDLTFTNGSPMLVLKNYQQQEQTGTLLLNLQSGQEQLFPGEWDAFISETQTVYLKGQWPRTSDRAQAEPGEQLYEVRNGRQLTRLQMNEFIGDLLWVQENTKQTYLLFAVQKGERVSYCVQAREQVINDAPVCDYFQGPQGTQAAWNPHKDQEAVFLSPAGELFTMDPFQGEIAAVSHEIEPDRFASLSSLFEQKGTHEGFLDTTHELQRGRKGLEIHEHQEDGRWVYARLFAQQPLQSTEVSWYQAQQGQYWLCQQVSEIIQSHTGCEQ